MRNLITGVGPPRFGVPPIGESAAAQPLAAFPRYKYRLSSLPSSVCGSHRFHRCLCGSPLLGLARSTACSPLGPRPTPGSRLTATAHRFSSRVGPASCEDFRTFVISRAYVFILAGPLDAKATLDGPPLPRSLKAHFILLFLPVLPLSHHSLLRFGCVHLAAIPGELEMIGMTTTRAPTKCSLDRSCRSRDLTNRKNASRSRRGSCRCAANVRLEAKILEEVC